MSERCGGHTATVGCSDDPPGTDQAPQTGGALGIDSLIAELRRKGQRSTTARRAVLEQLLAAGDAHLGVDELAARVAAEHPSVHLSTIYRTLDALEEVGLVTRAPLGDHPASYHLTHDVHHHAVCSECATVLNLAPSMFEDVWLRLQEESGFRADPHHLTIDGLCRDCANQ
jgi:Fur family ferric uptake transcriptional regulator